MSEDPTQAPAAFVTFYSFKGGVGRSMALINVAGILAGRGFRVLALDMDLEAPGISYLTQAEAHQDGKNLPGFVDLVADACARGPEADIFALAPGEVVDRYSYEYAVPEAIRESDEGLLRIMPAGRLDGDYQGRLDGLTLGQLYRDGTGQPLVAAFKQILRDSKRFDFVFVDSRTGFSDEAGICTRDLADCLMIVMGLNRQNVEGTATFLRSLREAGVTKPLRVALSPVPNGEDELVEKREKKAGEALTSAYGQAVKLSLQIPYHPRLALTEEPHIFRRSRGYLYDAYARIERAVITMAGHSPDAYRRAIEAAASDGQITVLMAHLKKLRRLDRTAEVLEYLAATKLADIYLREDAGELRLHIAEALPMGSWLMGHIGARLSEVKSLDAELFYRRALEANPNDVISLGNYALFLTHVRRDHDGAESLFQRALDANSPRSEVFFNYADLLVKIRKDYDGAEALHRRAVEIRPKDATTLVNYAAFLSNVRADYSGAKSIYERALDADPSNAGILGEYATFLSGNRKDHDEAEALYERAIQIDPKNVENIGNYANFMTDVREDHDRAEVLYKRALELEPNNSAILGNFAMFLVEARGDHDRAEAFHKRALDIDPVAVPILGSYANLLASVRADYDGAEALYERALGLDPNDVTILGNFARFLVNARSDYDRAEAFYKRALNINPIAVSILSAYANLLVSVRADYDGAEALYKRAIDADPRDTRAIGPYANLLIYVRGDYDGAEALYKRVIDAEADPSANTLGNYAQLLFIRGQTESATALVARALEQAPREPELQSELHFYAYAHAWQRWPDSLSNLKRLLQGGARSKGWPLQKNVAAAMQQGHPAPDFLAALAHVVSDEASIDTLDRFPEWQNAHF